MNTESTTEDIEQPEKGGVSIVANMGLVVGVVSILLAGAVLWYFKAGQPQGVGAYVLYGFMGVIALFVAEYSAWHVRHSTAKETDFRSVAAVGLIWVPLGLIINLYSLTAVGLVFAGAGFYGVSACKKKERSTSEKRTQQNKGTIAMLLGACILIGAVLYVLYV